MDTIELMKLLADVGKAEAALPICDARVAKGAEKPGTILLYKTNPIVRKVLTRIGLSPIVWTVETQQLSGPVNLTVNP